MDLIAKGSRVETGGRVRWLSSFVQLLWPRLIELWIALVLVVFLVIRILGSETGQRILKHFPRLHHL